MYFSLAVSKLDITLSIIDSEILSVFKVLNSLRYFTDNEERIAICEKIYFFIKNTVLTIEMNENKQNNNDAIKNVSFLSICIVCNRTAIFFANGINKNANVVPKTILSR